jgi:CubicO group peptidase (beta-lactamase class C family)
LREALAELVFGPAGLRRTAVAESLDDALRLTPGYSTHLDDDGRLRDATRRYHPGWVDRRCGVPGSWRDVALFRFNGNIVLYFHISFLIFYH